MAAECCDDIVGGQVYLSVGDARYEGSGEATIRVGGIERNAGSTSGGRMWVTETARLAEIEMSFFNHCDSDPHDLFNAKCKVDVTFVEETRGFRHFFTQAAIVGFPDTNTASGVISGMRIVCAVRNYSRSTIQ